MGNNKKLLKEGIKIARLDGCVKKKQLPLLLQPFLGNPQTWLYEPS